MPGGFPFDFWEDFRLRANRDIVEVHLRLFADSVQAPAELFRRSWDGADFSAQQGEVPGRRNARGREVAEAVVTPAPHNPQAGQWALQLWPDKLPRNSFGGNWWPFDALYEETDDSGPELFGSQELLFGEGDPSAEVY